MRDRELEAFRHFSDYNRLLAGAVSHEIRNLCSAIRVVTSNLSRHTELVQDADFQALTKLVESLSQIASIQLRQSKQSAPGWCKLGTVLEQLRLVIEPDWADVGGEVNWDLNAADARVQGDEHGLLQVFLNLTQNALRAAQQSPRPTMEIRTRALDNRVVVSFIDSGPGIRAPETLFRPFRQDANGTGLGLYVSRALTRTFGGDINHHPTDEGCRFDVTLLGWQDEE
jgi:signal transduction histidine kinase